MPVMQTWECLWCGKTCEREAVRGQRPKWCSRPCRAAAERAKVPSRACVVCGTSYQPTYDGQRYCSQECVHARQRKPRTSSPEPGTPRDARSELRRAIEDADYPRIIEAVRARVEVVGECWVWLGQVDRNYPMLRVSNGKAKSARSTCTALCSRRRSAHRSVCRPRIIAVVTAAA